MTRYEVLISRTALKQFESLESKTQDQIRKALDELAAEPQRAGVGRDIKKLKGSGDPNLYRIRTGDYRIVHAVIGNEVRVTGMFHRKRGYGFLE